jgi:transcription-repair coupling factor (superfamily II helicase)
MKSLTQPLKQLEVYSKAAEKLNKETGVQLICGCIDSQKTHLAYALGESYAKRLIVTYSELKAKEIFEEYKVFGKNVYLYPAKDFLFFHADIQGGLLEEQRILALQALVEQEQVTIITTIDGCMGKVRPLQTIQNQILTIDMESIVELDALKVLLSDMGYERAGQVEAKGQFAIRGGIIDIFPLTEEVPVRIELWDEEVDSIRSFDAESQRSIENLDCVKIYPAKEPDAVKMGESISFLEYFANKNSVVFLDEPHRLAEKANAVEKEFCESIQNRIEQGKAAPEEAYYVSGAAEVLAKLEMCHCAAFCMLDVRLRELNVKNRFAIEVKGINSYQNSFELLTKDLKRWKKEKYRTVLLCSSRTRAKRLALDLQNEELNAFYTDDESRVVNPGEIVLLYGNVKSGYEYPMLKFAVLSETDIFGADKKKKKKKQTRYEGQKIQSFSELAIGDYVVHENHGLGIYRGIEKVEVEKKLKDYIKIEYAGSGALYILATQLETLQKYASADAKKPKLNKLGGSEWSRTKTKVRTAVQDIAKDLVELYAARAERNGFVYGEDTVWQTEFEEMFPFDETDDQIAAIEATKRDMESTKIMDRLVCGDVGYGKTEIAIRAAFKAVQENKQVVYLVPTTILAQQHYNTFVQRMKEFPVRVDLMCRFRTPAQQKQTLEDMKKGLVDIVIGTHRLLSKDVQYKDLGLLIIDEEQRFGVTHKEKIKKLKENIDVLTLTATPIPRTLHMSLIGIRDMSVLEEAPQDRLPIQTYVMEYEDEMVRAAIHRELARGGQVYFVYNRVNTIAEMAAHIEKLVPEANVAFAHGQMSEKELEKKMYEFISGETDVLVSTTIVETGLDISNANTMIIHDADQMGLSQLYQLRGRVGRSNRTAYAFLLYRRGKYLSEIAEKRLHAIREFTDLGSGFKIAMRDLEIRGAGNLLGAEQHGHMQSVGYDLYCKMLNEAVKELKGTAKVEDKYETVLDLETDAYIPDSYIKNEAQKLDVYKRIAGIENAEECEDMLEELTDRFGDTPKAVMNLLEIAKLKAWAHSLYITEISGNSNRLKITMYEKADIVVTNIPKLIERYQGALRFQAAEAPYFVYERKNNKKTEMNVLKTISYLLEDMKLLTEET